jgi:hypothetical protein
MIFLTPALDLTVAASILYLIQRPKIINMTYYIKHALIWGVSLGYVALNISVLRIDTWQEYQSVQTKINRIVQPGDSIMGAQLYWFGLSDHQYYSWEQLIYYQRYAPGTTLEQAFGEFTPDIFIIDGHVNQYISDDAGSSPYLQNLRLSKSEMDAFIEKRSKLITTFDSAYGQIRIYRINWHPD